MSSTKNVWLAIVLTAVVAVPLGGLGGFLVGLYCSEFGKKLIAAVTAIEVPADVAKTKAIARDHYEMMYPQNWKLEQGAEHFDIDGYFSIDSPGGSYVAFEIDRVETSPKDNVGHATEYFKKSFRVSNEKSFTTWGNFSGEGVQLDGSYIGEPCIIRIFSHSTDNVSFTVTEFYDKATAQLVRKGFELVETTFKLKPPN